MTVNTSYRIGNGSAFVGSILSNLAGRHCGSIYRYNDFNRNNALLFNGVKQTKYPQLDTMIWDRNIGEYAYLYDNEWRRPALADVADSSIMDYIFRNDEIDNVSTAVRERLNDALNNAEANIMLANGTRQYTNYIGTDDNIKYIDVYDSESIGDFNTTDGGLLGGRMVRLLQDTMDIHTYEAESDIASYASDSDQNKLYDAHTLANTDVKLHSDALKKVMTIFGPFSKGLSIYRTSYNIQDHTKHTFNVSAPQPSIVGNYDGIDVLDRLSDLYINSNNRYLNVNDALLEKVKEILNIAKYTNGAYVENGTGHDVKGEITYGVGSIDYRKGYKDGHSINKEVYSEDMGINQYRNYSDIGKNTAHLLYDETSEGDSHILNLGTDADNNVSEGYVIMDIGDSSMRTSSLLSKTNSLFRDGKIGSLINRFHTKRVPTDELTSATDSLYGMSRGRNLRKDSVSQHYGYDNPYCRVWTSIHQYSKYSDLIRPFSEDGEFMTPEITRKDLGGLNSNHNLNLDTSGTMTKYGVPRIAPTTTEDVRRCMFSIENLAWKGVNFDSYVNKTNHTTLSKEQQGPNGGRIMWFPPYNLKFTENVGVQWEGNSFIGRGEQVYTYANTERSGTLNFTLLIDHPSIIDKWSRTINNVEEEHEHALLKFFAGCDTLVPDSKPTVSKERGEAIKEIDKKWIPEEPKPVPEDGSGEDRYYIFFPNDFSGIDYINGQTATAIAYLCGSLRVEDKGYEYDEDPLDTCIKEKTYTCKNKNGATSVWYYQPDKRCEKEVLYINKAKKIDNYKDNISYSLNRTNVEEEKRGLRWLAYSADTENSQNSQYLRQFFKLDLIPSENVYALDTLASMPHKYEEYVGGDSDYELSAEVKGYASSHGYKASNTTLSDNRAKVIAEFMKSLNIFPEGSIKVVDSGTIPLSKGNNDVNSFEAKASRSVEVIVKYTLKQKVDAKVEQTEADSNIVIEERDGQRGHYETTERIVGYKEVVTVSDEDSFDNEYLYFRDLDKTAPLIRKNIVEKIQYFDPAFHSITPEGFNGRLAFLHQCTRQGPTTAIGEDSNSKGNVSAGNLAFGRPPICVLRIGDFYNTKIIIDSIGIDYSTGGGVQWDMNPEGIGLQPMMADISISFKFLGGSDITGPIARLQNAVSDNFYANESVYNDRADYRDAPGNKETMDESMSWNPMVVEEYGGKDYSNHKNFKVK